MLEQILQTLRKERYSARHEADMQAAVKLALFGIEAEVTLSDADRIDFLTPCGIGIECKVDGSVPMVIAQLQRYAASERVRAIVLLTTCQRHRGIPSIISGKPIHVLYVGGGL